MKKALNKDWYKRAFTLHTMVASPWTMATEQDLAFVLNTLALPAGARVLDLACGFGRHSQELARRGFRVVGIDISEELISYARNEARQSGLQVDYISGDIRQLSFHSEFDAVLGLYEGAIGYSGSKEDDYKILTGVAQALKNGGRYIAHIPNIEYARKRFPEQRWRANSTLIELIEYDWDESARMIFETTYPMRYGEKFEDLKPVYEQRRVYELNEWATMLSSLGLRILQVCGALDEGSVLTDDYDFLSIISVKL